MYNMCNVETYEGKIYDLYTLVVLGSYNADAYAKYYTIHKRK